MASTGRASSNSIPARPPITGTSALTPPEENAPQTRKRFAGSGADAAAAAAAGNPQQSALYKRRRMTNIPSTSTSNPAAADKTPAAPRQQRTNSGFTDPTMANPAGTTAAPTPSSTSAPAAPTPASAPANAATGSAAPGPAEGGVLALAEALRLAARTTGPRWQEQAMEIFFRDFGDEDMDLQLKIAEKALTDENKALVFCKMPVALRRHWIKRLREVNNRGVN
jgi:hypothetical protein